MSRDARTQRGLAVARRMQQHQPNFERGMSELARLGSRLSASDVRLIESADARGGLPAVQALLADVGLSADGFHALSTQYGRGGLGAVSQAVQAQAAHEQAAQVEHLAAEVIGGLSPQQRAAAQQLLAADPTGVRLGEEAVRLGVPVQVAARAAAHLAQHGVEATWRGLAAQAQEQARADALHKSAEKDLAAAKEGDPFADATVHRATLAYYSTHAARLEAAGVGRQGDESPVQWLRRVAQSNDMAAKVAEATGTAPDAMRAIVEGARTKESAAEVAELKRGLLERSAARDEKHRAKHGESSLNDADKALKASAESRRRVLEEAYDASQPSLIATDADGTKVELPGTTTHISVNSTRKAALVRGLAEQSGESIVADVPGESGLSRHEVLSRAYDLTHGAERAPAQEEVDE